MTLPIHTIARDGKLYHANAIYTDGKVTVLKGSHINLTYGEGFKPTDMIAKLHNDRKVISEDGTLLIDIDFSSLSTAASFVAGRISNGMLTWKTENGKYVRETLRQLK